MANLTGVITNPATNETTTVTLELDDLKAWTWVTGHIAAKGYDQLKDADGVTPISFVAQATLALADMGKLLRENAQRYELQTIRKAARLARQNKLDDTVWDSGITLP